MFRTGILIAASLVVVLAGAAQAAVHEVRQKDKTFSVTTLTVKPGDTIVFKNDDDLTHNVYSTAKGNEFNLRAQSPGTNTSVALAAEGTVEIRCAFHSKMKLVVTVRK
jgi:plastocyanin